MVKYYILVTCLFLGLSISAREVIYKNAEANQKIKGASLIRYTDQSNVPNYIQFIQSSALSQENMLLWMQQNYAISQEYGFVELNRTKDEMGIDHIRYRQTFKGIPIQGTMYIVHAKNGYIQSMNGIVYNDLPSLNIQSSLSEATSLQLALDKVNAAQYKWQIASEEAAIKVEMKNNSATYYPKAEKVILKSGNSYYVCYAFNIYAHEPMGRTIEYVDVHTGKIILSKNLIETINANGTAVTKFSGTKPFQTDSVSAASFRLRDASRGLGVNTYNMQHGTTTGGSVDFTDADNYWNNVNANVDEAATDAHWGAQKTYDYFFNKQGRNSIDNAGYALNSYIHYSNNYVNAFWNGTRMTYGDGDISQGFMIMTALDVCGHEITHGLTSFTADLSATSSGADECDALNEAYSDVFGTSVERYARPTQWDWIIGGDITCTTAGVPDGAGIRSMSNPLSMAQPICYQGANWSATGEPHDNDGPLNYWFYLLTTGSASNNITALGHDTSEKIAFRTLTIHLFPSATYADARFYSILSASELYGGCTIPVIATTNAWSTVCVGSPFVASPTVSNFTGNILQTCDTSLTVTFTNSSINATTYTWNFGDGTTSTLANPTHTYSTGIYSVKLIADGGGCGMDSFTHIGYIHVGSPQGPSTIGASICTTGSATISATPNVAADTIRWYSTAIGGTSLASGTSYTTPVISTTTTYYAEEISTAPTYHVGPLNNTIGAGSNYTSNTSRFMIFDCASPTVLKSVWVTAGTAGNRTIVLKNSAGTTLQSMTVNIPIGASVVTLNMPLPMGTGLQLGLSATPANLYRNTAGASYPYSNGPITITGNTGGFPDAYYFFYDWVLKANDCYSVRTPTTVIVTGIGPTPAFITPPSGLSACAPSTVQLNANSGTGLFYQWYNGTTAIGGATNSIYLAGVSGSYSVVVSSLLPCLTPGTSASVSVSINSATSVSVTPSSATTFCQGGDVILNGTVGSGLNYQWLMNGTPIFGATSSAYTATQTGSYSVQVTNASSCSTTSINTNVTTIALPLANVTPNGLASFCQGGNLILNANTGLGFNYQWLLNGSPIVGATSASYTANQAGDFSVEITNASNCMATSANTTVSIDSLPIATISCVGSPIICQGNVVSLDANAAFTTGYQWYLSGSPILGATNASYGASQAGNYTVDITAGACTVLSSSFAVSVNPLPIANITPVGSTILCQGDNVQLNANTGVNLTYQWYLNGSPINGATSSSYGVAIGGNYSVEVTNVNNCSETSTNTLVVVNPIPTPVIINTAGVLSVSGGPYISYQWYLNSSPIAGATNATFTVTQNGTYRVQVNKEGCLGSSVQINLTGVGVKDVESNSAILISPNPTNDVIHIEGILPAKIVVRNLQGQLIKEVFNQSDISLSEVANGMYMIQLFDQNERLLLKKKIVKQ